MFNLTSFNVNLILMSSGVRQLAWTIVPTTMNTYNYKCTLLVNSQKYVLIIDLFVILAITDTDASGQVGSCMTVFL